MKALPPFDVPYDARKAAEVAFDFVTIAPTRHGSAVFTQSAELFKRISRSPLHTYIEDTREPRLRKKDDCYHVIIDLPLYELKSLLPSHLTMSPFDSPEAAIQAARTNRITIAPFNNGTTVFTRSRRLFEEIVQSPELQRLIDPLYGSHWRGCFALAIKLPIYKLSASLHNMD